MKGRGQETDVLFKKRKERTSCLHFKMPPKGNHQEKERNKLLANRMKYSSRTTNAAFQ
jgi:lantibiotic modifying enzyme